jgi:hypothetical protein
MLEGGCLCGAIRYRVSGAPVYSVICHCATCRKASGAPSVAWLTFARTQFEFLSGEPRNYHSSQGVIRRFCGTCGSGISYETARYPDSIDLTTMSLDDPLAFPPSGEVWVEHRLPWEAVNLSVDQYARDSMGET